jgi:hypothetical protein
LLLLCVLSVLLLLLPPLLPQLLQLLPPHELLADDCGLAMMTWRLGPPCDAAVAEPDDVLVFAAFLCFSLGLSPIIRFVGFRDTFLAHG